MSGRHRRIDWANYAQAGPVRITNLKTGETRIERGLHPAEVKQVVAEGKKRVASKGRRAHRRKQIARAAREVHRESRVPARVDAKALNKAASPSPAARA